VVKDNPFLQTLHQAVAVVTAVLEVQVLMAETEHLIQLQVAQLLTQVAAEAEKDLTEHQDLQDLVAAETAE